MKDEHPNMARCPECKASLGELREDLVVQRFAGRFSESPAELTRIGCDRIYRGEHCEGVWTWEVQAAMAAAG